MHGRGAGLEGAGGLLNRRDALDIMRGRRRMPIDPRVPTTPGRYTSSFHRPGRHWLHQARSAVRCWANCVEGKLHPTKNRFLGGFSCGGGVGCTHRRHVFDLMHGRSRGEGAYSFVACLTVVV